MIFPTSLVLASRPRWIGMGAVTLSSDVSSTASALSNFLTSTGCVSTSFAQCSAFQSAYNAAGGGNQVLVVDGYYGPATQSALQEVFDQMGGGSAPSACVPGASTSSGTTSAALAPLPGGSSTMVIFGQTLSTSTVILAAGICAALGLVGAAMYKSHADKAHIKYRTRRPRRRRRRIRRTRRKGRR
jgi:hypothetical protein